jgi:Cof subfamily protein (haloacid dehalogenase superfamily)
MRFNEVLLVSDMDGTLLNPAHEIFEQNIRMIEEFISQGGCFTLATGREWHALGEYAPILPLTLPLILVNGAQIFDPVRGQVIDQTLLPGVAQKMLLEIADNYPELGLIAVTDDGALIMRQPADPEVMPDFYKDYPTRGMSEFPEKTYKILFVGSLEQLQIPKNRIINEFGEHLSSTCSYPTLLDIMAAGVSKGSALSRLKQQLQTMCQESKKIIAVGDQENDLEMFKTADYAYAMGQASDTVKSAANDVLPPNDEPFMSALLNKISRL